MVDVTLPELDPAAAISDADLVIVRQGADAVDLKGTALQLKTYIGVVSPGGSDTQIQFNDGGSFGGDADFTWNKTTNALTVNGTVLITSTSATAFRAGPSGAPALTVDGSVASSATGILITPAASGSGVTITATGGTNEPINISPKGTGDVRLVTSSSTTTFRLARFSGTDRLSVSQGSALFTPQATSTASTIKFSYVGPADTSLTAGTESNGIYWNTTATRQWASNTAITTQREFRISAPTYAFVSSGGVITNAYSFAIDGPPVAGTNATITNTWAFGVLSGNVRFAENLVVGETIITGENGGVGGSVKLFGSTSGDVTVQTAAAAGTATVFQLPADNGTNNYVLKTNGSGVTSWVALAARTVGFTVSGSGAATGKVNGYYTVPYSGTITGWSISVDTGTATVKTWKIANGTAVPTISNVISTSGVSISTGTHIRSSTVTDFTSTTVTAGDIIAFDITAISGVTQMTFQLEITTT